MNPLIIRNKNLPSLTNLATDVQYLMPEQLNNLTTSFQNWFDSASTLYKKKVRGRYWIVFLTLRYTGARLGEVQRIDDVSGDIDYRNAEIKLVTLKRHSKTRNGKKKLKKEPTRIVPVPAQAISEIATFLAEIPEMRGQIFKIDQGNFRRVFYKIAEMAKIPKDLAHPHILRHTRAIELVRNNIPASSIQYLLGHTSLNTTAIYLRISNHETKQLMMERGLI